MGNLLLAIDRPNLVKGLDRGRQSAVNAKDLAVDDGRQTEVVEDLGAVAPHRDGAVLPQALVVEAVDLRDLAGFVVAADEGDAVGVADFERQQQEERLHAVEAAVHKVAHEKVIGVGDVAAHFEQFFEIVKLTVDVAANLRGENESNIRK